MANTKVPWDIVDLTEGSDHDVDHNFKNLRIAASRAQYAASQYLKQTMSVESVHDSQGQRNLSQPTSHAVDSGLGTSVSETEGLREAPQPLKNSSTPPPSLTAKPINTSRDCTTAREKSNSQVSRSVPVRALDVKYPSY